MWRFGGDLIVVNLFDGIVWVDVVVWVDLGACMDSAFFVCWCSMAFAGGFGLLGCFRMVWVLGYGGFGFEFGGLGAGNICAGIAVGDWFGLCGVCV